MRLQSKFVNEFLDPNPDPLVLEKTFIDVSNLSKLKGEYLYRPGAFLLVGDRGSGKTTLFRILYDEFLVVIEKKYEKTQVLKNLRVNFSKLFLKQPKAINPAFLQLPAYVIVRPIEDMNSLKINFIAGIIKELTKQMLFINKIAAKEIFKTDEELLNILFKIKGIELHSGAEMGISIGGNFIPITIKGDVSKSMISKTETLPQHYDLLDDLHDLIERNSIHNPHFIVLLDEFDKLENGAGKLLRDHQAILFERFRKYCSFVIPCTHKNAKRLYSEEYKGIYNFDPFELKLFTMKHTRELLQKRLSYYKSGLNFSQIITPETLEEIGTGLPRTILDTIKIRIKENNYKIPI